MISMSVAYSATFSPVPHKPNYVPTESLQLSYCQKCLETDQTRSFLRIALSVGRCLSFSSLRRITDSDHYKSIENCILVIVSRNSSNHLFHDDFDVSGLNPVPHKPNYVTNESLQISFCQKLYGTDQTNCFIMIFMSVGHSLSFSSLRCIKNSHIMSLSKTAFFNSSRKQLKSSVS